jgi:Kef-type K+ transport system membrane component KefB
MGFRDLLISLVLVRLAAKVGGEVMSRIGQTAVLGELLAGVVIGPGVLGLVHESDVLHALAELGVLILLFEVGLESDLGDLLRAGLQATLVALAGVAAPFAVGFYAMQWLGHSALVGVFVGATLTATSVGITARVLADLGRLQDAAAKVVLGAAVVDDILGLIILAVVTGVARSGGVSAATVGLIFAKAVAFLLLAIVLGLLLAPLTSIVTKVLGPALRWPRETTNKYRGPLGSMAPRGSWITVYSVSPSNPGARCAPPSFGCLPHGRRGPGRREETRNELR